MQTWALYSTSNHPSARGLAWIILTESGIYERRSVAPYGQSGNVFTQLQPVEQMIERDERQAKLTLLAQATELDTQQLDDHLQSQWMAVAESYKDNPLASPEYGRALAILHRLLAARSLISTEPDEKTPSPEEEQSAYRHILQRLIEEL